MKQIKLLALLAMSITLVQCKTAAPTASNAGTPSVLEVTDILDSAQLTFLAYANQTGGDVRQSMIQTVSWLNAQPNVQSVASSDSLYIDITLKSGLTTSFYFEEINDSGFDIFRGGGHDKSDEVFLTGSGQHSANSITNKNVLIFAADTKSLESVIPQIAKTVNRLTNSGLGLNVTVLKDAQCSYGVVEHFGDYGLVIMDTHGDKNAFLVGSTLDLSTPSKTEADLKSKVSGQIDAAAYDKLTSGNLKLAASIKANPNHTNWQKSVVPNESRTIWFSSKYLNLLPPMTNTVILGNMCFSGWSVTSWSYSWPTVIDTNVNGIVQVHQGGSNVQTTDPIRLGFTNRNLISYYGYSHADGTSASVQDTFAARMEDLLVQRLVGNTDSTKIINLQANNTDEYFNQYSYEDRRTHQEKMLAPLYLKHFGADNYSYEQGCVDTFTDARDGHLYHAVCINGQNWMAENLDYAAAGSICYGNTSGNCDTYGRLYDWATIMQGADSSSATPSGVQGICPKGWHVPSYDEIVKLIMFVGGKSGLAGSELRASTTWLNNGGGTNTSGFAAVGAGDYALNSTTKFENIGLATYFWTSTTVDIYGHKGFFDILGGQEPVTWGGEDPTLSFSCRCVKDP
jgi:uncharacterized protein (TIGR02145 family)